MSSYKHYKYLSDNFPERIKKARESKIAEKESIEITEEKKILIRKYK